jgi:glutamate 5-kinase
MKKRLVLKIGTSTLTNGTKLISRGKVEDIGRQILALRGEYEIVLVSSGAIAAAKQFVNINDPEKLVASKQAMAAIGQPLLMRIYNEIFSDFGIRTAQCLMTYRDFENENFQKKYAQHHQRVDQIRLRPDHQRKRHDRRRRNHPRRTTTNFPPSSPRSSRRSARHRSDIDGVFDKNPHLNTDAKLIPKITNIHEAKSLIEERDSGLGTGGMNSKLEAAIICQKENIETWIVGGARNNFLIDALEKKVQFTKFR